jgi:hypothetical protein
VFLPHLAAVTGLQGKSDDAYPEPYLKVFLVRVRLRVRG